jgi:hypothetical protein
VSSGFRKTTSWAYLLAVLALPLGLSTAAQAKEKTPAQSSPCTTVSPECTEWVALAGGPSRAMVYRTFPLNVRNANLHHALIMIHGTNRNADHYFRNRDWSSISRRRLERHRSHFPRVSFL